MKACSIVALLTLVALAESFAPLSTSAPRSTVSLNLKQGQGSQLVAAWNAAHPDEDNDEQDHAQHHETHTTTKHNKAREFVSRVFSIAFIRDSAPPLSSSKKDWKTLCTIRLLAFNISRQKKESR